MFKPVSDHLCSRLKLARANRTQMQGEGIKWLLQLHSSASRNLARDEGREAGRLMEIVKQFLWQRARALVREANGRPVLYSYGSDGTPLLTKESVAAKPCRKTILYRRARQSGEYLVERGFLLTHNPDGSFKSAGLFREPRLLTEGKTGLHSSKAATEFWPMIRKDIDMCWPLKRTSFKPSVSRMVETCRIQNKLP